VGACVDTISLVLSSTLQKECVVYNIV
jgi:hypothetical protein